MITQFCGSYRLRRAGIPYITRYHDATNAFYCVKKHHLVASAMDLAKEDKTHFLDQRIMNSTFWVQDGALGAHMHNHEGALSGDHASMKICVQAYSHGAQLTVDSLERDKWQTMLKVVSLPIGLELEHSIDLSTSGFVDD
eukprot:3618452-Pyramimonas_sp.AAC.1